jgi:hypothetical protein
MTDASGNTATVTADVGATLQSPFGMFCTDGKDITFMRRGKATWRITALLIGVVLPLAVLFPLQALMGTDSRWLMPVFVAGYGLAGGIMGFLYPERGWRSGFWLIAFSLILFVGSGVFVGSAPPWDWRKEVKNLTEDALIFGAAFVGAALVAFVRRHLMTNPR